MKFSEWLVKHYKVKLRDIKQLNPPWLWRKFKWIGAIAIKGKYVYIKNLKDIKEQDMCITLTHEAGRHIMRQRKLRWPIFLLKYGLSKSFRRGEEVQAYTRTMETRHLFKLSVNPDRYAKSIRDNYYVGNRQYRIAKKDLRNNYEDILSGEINIVRNLYKKFVKEKS